MPSSDNFFSGKNGKVTVNGTELLITGWKVEPEAERHDVTHTGSSGFGNIITSIKRAKFTIEMNWNAQQNPLDDPPNLVEGATITNVKCYLDGLTSPFWLFSSAKVLTNPVESKVGDVTKITVNCESDGSYTRPTGNFAPSA